MSGENTNYVSYLVERSQNGVRNAFFDLCEINLNNVFNLICRLMADYELAKKITLDVFYHAWETIKEFKSDTSYLLWIKDLAIKYSLFELNRDGLITYNKNIDKPDEDPHQYLEQLMMSLPDEDRVILVLHDIEGYTYEEINTYLTDYSHDEIKSKLINTREYLLSKL